MSLDSFVLVTALESCKAPINNENIEIATLSWSTLTTRLIHQKSKIGIFLARLIIKTFASGVIQKILAKTSQGKRPHEGFTLPMYE